MFLYSPVEAGLAWREADDDDWGRFAVSLLRAPAERSRDEAAAADDGTT
jgi:hypothetical protein